MSNTLLSYIEPPKSAQATVFTLQSSRSAYKIQVELFNCERAYLSTVRKVICLHSAPHSVALFLKMKDHADLALYCHPLLAFPEEKAYVLAYTAKYQYPLAILTVIDTLDNLFIRNGIPTHFREFPVFTLSEQDNLTLMRTHGIQPSINYSSYNRHGCYLCPFASRKYYEQIQQGNPVLFAECQRLMQRGSIGRGDPPYYYYPKDRLI